MATTVRSHSRSVKGKKNTSVKRHARTVKSHSRYGTEAYNLKRRLSSSMTGAGKDKAGTNKMSTVNVDKLVANDRRRDKRAGIPQATSKIHNLRRIIANDGGNTFGSSHDSDGRRILKKKKK